MIGRFRPFMPVSGNTFGPRTSNFSICAMRHSTFGNGLPTEPIRYAPVVLIASTGEVSVKSVAFKDANADAREPAGRIHAQRRAACNVVAHASAKSMLNLAEKPVYWQSSSPARREFHHSDLFAMFLTCAYRPSRKFAFSRLREQPDVQPPDGPSQNHAAQQPTQLAECSEALQAISRSPDNKQPLPAAYRWRNQDAAP